MSKLTTASVLAFERNLDISDAFFWQQDSKAEEAELEPVAVTEKSVRGTISNRLKNAIAKDPTKLDAEIEKPNLQTVDTAALSENCDTLVVKWSCKPLPFSGKPSVCNDQAYQTKLMQTVEGYLSEQGLGVLASRYATNIANARWLWRNRVGAESVTVTVRCGDEKAEFTDAQAMDLNSFNQTGPELEKLTSWVLAGLTGERFVILYVEASAKVGYGQEVYPSQELILDTGKKKSKVLYQIKDKAAMHSQKISNAIRTIDNWYPDAQFPVAIEPYAAVTTLGAAFRQPNQKSDFYSIFDDWVLNDKSPSIDDQHYAIGVLLRGGVFGASGKE